MLASHPTSKTVSSLTVLSVVEWSFGENFPSWLIIARNLLSSETFLGGCISQMADILSGSGCTPLSSKVWPRNFNDCFLNSHFCGLRVTSFCCNLSNTAFKHRSCSSLSFPDISTSSIRHMHPSIRSETCFWNHWLCQTVVRWNSTGPLV